MAMDIASENPSSFTFKIDKNSPLASKLKASVAEKLNQFLVNYTDDVLAEYIVVLVCNGKDQSQARDDLEAFLGEKSGEFVSWLWDLLLRYVFKSGVKSKRRLRMLRGFHHHARGDANMLSDDEKEYCPSTFAPQTVSLNDNEASRGSQRSSPGFDTYINEISDPDEQIQTFKREIPKYSGPTKDNCSEVLKYGPSRVKVSSRISAGIKQSVRRVDEKKKLHILEQIVNGSRDHLPRQHLYLPRKEQLSSNLRSVTRENPKHGPSAVTDVAGRRLSSKPVESASHHNARPRGSVWDRLGKPRGDNNIVMSKDTEIHGGETHHQNRPMFSEPDGRLNERLTGDILAPDNSYGTVISNTNDDGDEYTRSEHDLRTMCLPHHADNSNKKRQFCEIGSRPTCGWGSLRESKHRHHQDRETLKEFQRSSSAKYSRSESLNIISSGARQTEELHTCEAFGAPDSVFISGANNVSQRKLSGEALEASPHTLVSNRLVTKSEPVNEDAIKANLKPVQAQMFDVKLRLHQIEMEMSKLREKQPESNEGQVGLLLSGALHPSDDVESRTIFVTNVHFAATKEALSLHFAKCGVVVKTIILNDPVTAQPEGAAYITFAHKESADKAVALTGTSFWSRTLKVVKNAEKPVVSSAPPQLAGKPSWSQSIQPNKKVIFPRPYASSLQWRRDQPVTTEHSICAPGYGLEASGTVEQNGDNSGGQLDDLSLANTSTAKEVEECKETHPAA